MDSRHLLFEAQQAHYYGLPSNRALASVTSTPARVMGMDHRIGYVSENFDAGEFSTNSTCPDQIITSSLLEDIVIWDSHPLALGATPIQVFIDGVAQLDNPHVVPKPVQFQKAPKTPDFSKEAAEAVEYEGLPPIEPKATKSGTVVFANVSSVLVRDDQNSPSAVDGIQAVFEANSQLSNGELGVAVVTNGHLECVGLWAACSSIIPDNPSEGVEVVNLVGGGLAPALVSYGSNLGLEEIESESSTRDGVVFDVLGGPGAPPSLLGGDESLIRAVDGLVFATRHA